MQKNIAQIRVHKRRPISSTLSSTKLIHVSKKSLFFAQYIFVQYGWIYIVSFLRLLLSVLI